MELIRTSETLTAGITNIPLTKPAFLYFKNELEDNAGIEAIYNIFENYKIPAKRTDNYFRNYTYFQSIDLVDSKIIKAIFRNWRTLKPKLITDWRYLFWEIDTMDDTILQNVIDVYAYLELPVFVQKTMRGFHFISVKPIQKNVFQWAIQKLRNTNDSYPPITLRIKPNKWVGEPEVFKQNWIVSSVFHSDTKYLRDWIMNQNFTKIGEQYQLVWYSIDKKKEVIAQ